MKYLLLLFSAFLLTLSADQSIADTPKLLPYQEEVHKIIDPLQYSGVPVIARPDVTLRIDFKQRSWTLRNVHEYDAKGNILLDDNRFGLCAELATFVFEKLKPLISDDYDLKFAMVGETGFFSSGQSNHIVLLLVDKLNKQLFLIDPSFHKFASLKDLPEYNIINIQDTLSFVRDQSHDVSFSLDQAIPLDIRGDVLLSFSVTSVDGKFDPDNFILAISASERYKFGGRDILVIGRRNKQFQDIMDNHLMTQILPDAEIKILLSKLKFWIMQMPQEAR